MQAVHLNPEAQSRLERQEAVLQLITFAKALRGPDRLPAIQLPDPDGRLQAPVTATDIISQHGMQCGARGPLRHRAVWCMPAASSSLRFYLRSYQLCCDA